MRRRVSWYFVLAGTASVGALVQRSGLATYSYSYICSTVVGPTKGALGLYLKWLVFDLIGPGWFCVIADSREPASAGHRSFLAR